MGHLYYCRKHWFMMTVFYSLEPVSILQTLMGWINEEINGNLTWKYKTFIRPTQDQPSSNCGVEEVDNLQIPCLPKELLIWGGRKNHFVCVWECHYQEDSHIPVAGPAPMYIRASLRGLSGLSKSNTKEPRSWDGCGRGCGKIWRWKWG